MTTDAGLYLRARRAALRAALREGDARLAARAAARSRIGGIVLDRSESSAVRRVRLSLGRALREARDRRDHPRRALAPRAVGALPATPDRMLRRLLIVAAIAAVLLLIFAAIPRGPAAEENPGGGTPAAAAVPPDFSVASEKSRGRSTTPEVSVVVVSAPPETPPPATAAPASLPPRSAAPAGGGGGVGGSGGGSGGGTGAGVGTGSGTASPRATPTPTPTPVATPTPTPVPSGPTPLQPGMVRISVHVFDSITGAPLQGACISIGFLDCAVLQSYTDAQGSWYIDVQQSDGIQWDVKVQLKGYITATRRVLTQNQTEVTTTFQLLRSL